MKPILGHPFFQNSLYINLTTFTTLPASSLKCNVVTTYKLLFNDLQRTTNTFRPSSIIPFPSERIQCKENLPLCACSFRIIVCRKKVVNSFFVQILMRSFLLTVTLYFICCFLLCWAPLTLWEIIYNIETHLRATADPKMVSFLGFKYYILNL